MNQENLNFFKTYKEINNAYQLAMGTLHFDISTTAPKAGIPYRNKMLSILAGEAFDYQMNPENLRRLEELYQEAKEGSELKKELELYFYTIEHIRKLPKDVYVKQRQTLADSEMVWQQAKAKNDYSLFEPYLEKVILMQKEALTYQDKDCSDYDYLLNRYQRGTSVETYDKFFQKIKDTLIPFIKKIQTEGKQIDNSLLFQHYDLDKQSQFLEELKDYLQVDRNVCYMAISEHPFTSSFSAKESRITTHLYENNVMSAIFSTIHEYGHAHFDLQIKDEYEGSVFKDAIGAAMHESQSRFLENHIGRSEAFWKANFPKLQKYFPDQLNDVTLDDFVKMINESHPGLVRLEADELTYPIHILIRYELEKAIFNSNVDLKQLDTLWDDKYEEYLGVRANNAAKGILQDIHWSAGDFGYFPTYALGSAYSAQFYHAMKKDIDVDNALANGHFELISKWLKEHVQQFGSSKTVDEILLETTGEPFNPDYYINYLIDKYSKLYQL